MRLLVRPVVIDEFNPLLVEAFPDLFPREFFAHAASDVIHGAYHEYSVLFQDAPFRPENNRHFDGLAK